MKLILFSLMIAISLTSCLGFGSTSPKVVPHKFDGFIIYDKPPRIPVKVYKNCYLDDTQIECIKAEDFKKAVIRARKLERIVDNYEADIRDYKELQY